MTPETSFQHALALHQAGRLDEANAAYGNILAVRPDHADALHFKGVIALQRGDATLAADLIARAITLQGNVASYHSHLGAALKDLGRVTEAEAACRRAVALDPNQATAWVNLGNVAQLQGQVDQATDAFRRAATLDPASPLIWHGLACALVAAHRMAEADDALHRAVALDPTHAQSHFRLAELRLRAGDFARGWPGYEWRYHFPHTSHLRRVSDQPHWDGGELNGKTILIHDEQGYGDTFQFCRYLPLVKARGGRVVFQVIKELRPLFEGFAGIDQLVIRDEQPPQFDVYCPLLSLPRIFGTRIDTIPAKTPYLAADPKRTAQWAKRLGKGKALKVGIVWAGTPTLEDDRWRSPGLAAVEPLFQVPNLRWFGLQMGAGRNDLAGWTPPASFTDLGPEIGGFEDTAAILASLDLMVSSCTAPLHLAGAMGRPAFGLLSHTADWRWLADRDDSPWYPSLRLFRQRRLGDWVDAIKRVATEL